MRNFLFAIAIAAAGVLAAASAHAGEFTYKGPRGGTTVGTVNCAAGVWRAGCRTNWNHTTAAGKVFSGTNTGVRGPFGATRFGHVTGPNGGTAAYWRRWSR